MNEMEEGGSGIWIEGEGRESRQKLGGRLSASAATVGEGAVAEDEDEDEHPHAHPSLALARPRLELSWINLYRIGGEVPARPYVMVCHNNGLFIKKNHVFFLVL